MKLKLAVLFVIMLIGGILTINFFAKKSNNVVVVYVSEDQPFSEPILKDFEKETGIKVKAIYDTEESKSTGTMNRLIAEKNNPQADVYWANEPIRAEVLKQKGITEPYVSPHAKDIPSKFKDTEGYWSGFSARIRVFIVNKKVSKAPESILDYSNPEWKAKGVIANPLFGTTTSNISALFVLLGDEKAKNFMEKMKKNQIGVSTSNGESADLVASGKYLFSLVDSDDAVNRIRQGKNVKIAYPDQKSDQIGCFVVPNTVMLIKGAPNKKNAQKLIDYLLSKKTEEKLAKADCAQIPLHSDVKPPKELKSIKNIKTMKINYKKIAKKMIEIQPYLKQWVK